MTTRVRALLLGTLCVSALTVPVFAHAPSGAIFTTVADGSEVNANIYPSKDAVYLDGAPGPGAPQTAAGLDDGRGAWRQMRALNQLGVTRGTLNLV